MSPEIYFSIAVVVFFTSIVMLRVAYLQKWLNDSWFADGLWFFPCAISALLSIAWPVTLAISMICSTGYFLANFINKMLGVKK